MKNVRNVLKNFSQNGNGNQYSICFPLSCRKIEMKSIFIGVSIDRRAVQRLITRDPPTDLLLTLRVTIITT